MTTNTTTATTTTFDAINFPLDDGNGNTYADMGDYAYAFARRSISEPVLDLDDYEAYTAAVEAYTAAVEALAAKLVAAATRHDGNLGDLHDIWWELV